MTPQSVRSTRWLKRKLVDDPEYKRRLTRAATLREHGLTIEQYDQMLAAQGGVCAICGQAETFTYRGRIRPLSVDHDHRTGRVRGVICHRCNEALGRIEFVPESPIQMALYLGASL